MQLESLVTILSLLAARTTDAAPFSNRNATTTCRKTKVAILYAGNPHPWYHIPSIANTSTTAVQGLLA